MERMNQDTTSSKKSPGKAVAAASIGNALEWYDFSVFAFFATYIGHSFFIDGDENSTLFKTFLIFAVGFIARPLGALYLGLYGDRVGRKSALVLTIALMAIGTLIIAIAPPIWMIGIGAPILLLVGRLLQGFSAGGEIGGATAFLVESAPKEKQAVYASWLQASMGISNILAALVGVTITSYFTDPEIHEWAWRIPFIIGLLIVPVGWYIRRNLDETEDFKIQQRAQQHIAPPTLKTILKEYPKHILFGFMFSILWAVSIYTFIIYMPTYYSSHSAGLGFTRNQAFTASLIGNVFMVVLCVVSGSLADRFGMARILKIGALILLFGSYPLLAWLQHSPTFSTLIMVHIAFCMMVSIFCGVAPAALASIFPVAVRTTGMSISYNIATIFFAGFAPALLTWATAYNVMAPSFYLIMASFVGLIALHFMFNLNTEVVLESQSVNKIV